MSLLYRTYLHNLISVHPSPVAFYFLPSSTFFFLILDLKLTFSANNFHLTVIHRLPWTAHFCIYLFIDRVTMTALLSNDDGIGITNSLRETSDS